MYVVCRTAYELNFPFYATRLKSKEKKEQVRWLEEYKSRAHREVCWRSGKLTHPETCLRGHCGTVFGAAFLEEPFRPGTIVTGAHLDTTSRGEIRMWMPTRGTTALDASTPSSSASLEVDAKEEVTRAGILSLYQLHNTPQISCTTFESGVHILRAQELQPCDMEEDENHDMQINKKHKTNLEDDTESIQRAFSHRMPDNPKVSKYVFYPVLEIKGQTAPCAKTFVDKQSRILSIPSYDGAVRLYKLPEWVSKSAEPEIVDDPHYQHDGGQCNMEPALMPSAVLMDDMELTDPDGVGTEKHLPVCALTMADDDSHRMVTAGNDMLVKAWDLQRECIIDRLSGHEGWIWNVKPLDPALRTCTSTATDGYLRTWDFRTGKCSGMCNVSSHGSGKVYPITGVAIRGNKWHIAMGSLDKSVYVVDLRMLRRLYCIGKHEDRVCRAYMYEDTLMTTGWDNVVRLWEFA